MKRSENSASTRKMPKVQAPPTMELENQPDFGRVVRDEHGHFRNVVEVKDCTPEELEIKEFNVGVCCVGAEALKWAQPRLSDDNAHGEYHLTDVVHILADADQRVETVHTENIEEALGINDRADLELAERIKDIASVESVSELGGCVHRAREPTANVLVESQRSLLPESLCDHDNRFREDLSG